VRGRDARQRVARKGGAARNCRRSAVWSYLGIVCDRRGELDTSKRIPPAESTISAAYPQALPKVCLAADEERDSALVLVDAKHARHAGRTQRRRRRQGRGGGGTDAIPPPGGKRDGSLSAGRDRPRHDEGAGVPWSLAGGGVRDDGVSSAAAGRPPYRGAHSRRHRFTHARAGTAAAGESRRQASPGRSRGAWARGARWPGAAGGGRIISRISAQTVVRRRIENVLFSGRNRLRVKVHALYEGPEVAGSGRTTGRSRIAPCAAMSGGGSSTSQRFADPAFTGQARLRLMSRLAHQARAR
jgi:hypothetical protein